MNPIPKSAMISIQTPGDKSPNLKSGWDEVFYTSFYDSDRINDIYRIISFRKIRDLYCYITSFQNKFNIENVFIHCDYGQNRSGAVAFFMASLYNIPIIDRDMSMNHKYNFRVFSRLLKYHTRMENLTNRSIPDMMIGR